MTAKALPTGEGTSPKNDFVDPHPSTEENYDTIPHPGGIGRRNEKDMNSYAHDGTTLCKKGGAT